MNKKETFINSVNAHEAILAMRPGLKNKIEKELIEEIIKIELNRYIDKTAFNDIEVLEGEFYRQYPEARQEVAEEVLKMIKEYMASLTKLESD